MRLYSGSSNQFVEDTIQNQIAEKMKNSYFNYFRYFPTPSEISAWRNSLRAMSLVILSSKLDDHGVILEYQLPLTSKRLDFLICGLDSDSKPNAVIVELKQWEKCEISDGENEVLTFVGGNKREVLHPSAQVGQYSLYLQDTHTAFYENPTPINLSACSYLHNYRAISNDPLFNKKFCNLLEKYPIFTEDDVNKLKEYLIPRLEKGEGLPVLARIENSKYRPNKKLMDHVGNLIKGKPEYILLDEQKIVYDKVLAVAKEGFHQSRKIVIIVKGGPGTGKSVIAINLMADLLLKGYNAHYATGSRAFTETLRKIIGKRGSVQFRFFNSYTQSEPNSVDILICDEAHRIRKTSNNWRTPTYNKSNIPQIDELLTVAKVVVFFIDDAQVVRPDEVGSVDYIKNAANRFNCQIFEYELEAQFRCAGSDAFVNWVNNTLAIKRTANVIWEGDEGFDFRIVESPQKLETMIREKVSQGYSGRIVAGFCWPWSYPKEDGTLVDDVKIGDYCRPWDARPDAKKLSKDIPPASLWAYDPNGINQIGCVYTAQGFEFDYIGVIFGLDLRYDFSEQRWKGYREFSCDNVVKRSKEKFTDLVKNTYRVLLTRGLKGCYIYFMDKQTENFFKSRIEIEKVVNS
ncbi:MAG: DUF2075 domain-containing protein [Methanomassiliicoccales archaeon]